MQVFFSWLTSRAARQALTVFFAVTCLVLGPAVIANSNIQFSHIQAVAKASAMTVTSPSEVAQAVTPAAAEDQPLLVAAADGQEHEVKMGSDSGLLAFAPKSLTISPGDKVDWAINKAPPHNVVFDTTGMNDTQKAFIKEFPKSQLMIAVGDTYSVTFPADIPPGRYPYYCTPHRGAGMVGEILVQ